MSSSLNHVQIIGNATKDPETKQVGGSTVSNVSVATNRTWIDKKTGEKKDQVEYHNIVCWGRLAEVVGQYLHKGNKVYFSGRIQTRSWEDKEGKKNYRTEIFAEQMILLGQKPSGQQPAQQNQDVRQDDGSFVSGPSYDGEQISVEDLPF